MTDHDAALFDDAERRFWGDPLPPDPVPFDNHSDDAHSCRDCCVHETPAVLASPDGLLYHGAWCRRVLDYVALDSVYDGYPCPYYCGGDGDE